MKLSIVTRLGGILAALVAWEGIVRLGLVSPFLFPSPTATAKALLALLSEYRFLVDIAASLQRVAGGFVVGSILGVALGLLTGRIAFGERAIEPLLQILRPIPVIALVPLSIIWFGIGEIAKWSLIAWGTLFPVWINTHLGCRRIPQDYIWTARSLGASDRRIFLEVVVPFTTRFIANGLRTGSGIAFVCVVAAELSGAVYGLGARIHLAYMTFSVASMLGCIVVLGVLGSSADILLSWLLKRLWPWHEGLSYLG